MLAGGRVAAHRRGHAPAQDNRRQRGERQRQPGCATGYRSGAARRADRLRRHGGPDAPGGHAEAGDGAAGRPRGAPLFVGGAAVCRAGSRAVVATGPSAGADGGRGGTHRHLPVRAVAGCTCLLAVRGWCGGAPWRACAAPAGAGAIEPCRYRGVRQDRHAHRWPAAPAAGHPPGPVVGQGRISAGCLAGPPFASPHCARAGAARHGRSAWLANGRGA
ncbi:hypothetical protein D3C72_1302210 [compost metagenome]